MQTNVSPEARNLVVNTIKCLSMDAVEKAQSGHPGTPMGLADIATEIWLSEMKYNAKDPHWPARDRFVLSCGHASMLLYSLLHLADFGLSLDDIKAFRQWGSKTPGHPEVHHTAGVETTTGPLGQGISNAVGMALGAKMKAARFGELFGYRVFVIASDGDLMEGVSAEASSLAGHLGLNNLVVFWDDNRITIDGSTEITFTEDVGARYEAYGWRVVRIDGHDVAQIRKALDTARTENEKPVFIVARTHIANGAPNVHDTSGAHGAPLGAEEISLTKKAMGCADTAFEVPAGAYEAFKARAKAGEAAYAEWQAKVKEWRTADSARAAAYDAFEACAVPADIFERMLAKLPEKDDATRSLGGVLLQEVGSAIPGFVGGAADLVGSTKTAVKGAAYISKGKFEGRNLHFGIREHGMGAICNGLALSGGFLPFASTFLVFSDYMRPSIRLSALMELPCWWIFTHDSIFLGEDGPTHQPVEHLASLRLIPNLAVFRPADAMEIAACYTMALGRKKGPSVFSLTRQKVTKLARPEGFDPKSMLRGGYVAAEATGGKPDLVLVATGSEVELAMHARVSLEKSGKRVRVVSMPSVDVFLEQDAAYRADVFPDGAKRVSIEAGVTDGWRGLLGEKALCLGIDRFGASAPDKILAQQFGFTAEAIVTAVSKWLASS
ncbi:MAG: transketolase [Polyangiaceae bacterium]